MTVAQRLALSFAVLIALVCAIAGIGLYAIHKEHGAFAHFVADEGRRLALAHRILDEANVRAVSARNLVLVRSDADRQAEKGKVDRAHAAVGQALRELKGEFAASPDVERDEMKLIEAIEAVEQRYGPVALDIVARAMSGQREEAITRMDNECRPLLQQLIAAADAYGNFIAKAAEKSVADSTESYQRIVVLMSALVVVALLGAVLLARALVVGITRPLRRAVEVARAVAAGDLTVPIDVDRKDELGELLVSLKDMTRQLAGLVGKVHRSSDSISVGSREIATGSQDLSVRTERQGASLQAAASSMEQMSSAVQSSSAVASQAVALANSAARTAQEGGLAVEGAVKTMRNIAESAQRIAEINAVIDGIAFQTNILALNAAVEAARAGEHGRGFAVVASEVRSLAGRASEAAREIKSLIATSTERVETGTSAVDEAGARMGEIVQQVAEVARLIGQIGASTSEQTAGITAVAATVAALDQGTQQNAALVEESSAAAMNLKEQAEQLVQAVSVFRLA